MFDPEATEKKKRIFAAALLHTPNDPSAAARAADPWPTAQLYILQNWQFDDDVQAYMRELRDVSGPNADVPEKDQFAAQVYQEATKITDPALKLSYLKFVADMRGFTPKGPQNIINNNNVVDKRKVIFVPQAPATLDEWEAEAVEQQAALVNAANG